MKTNVVKEFKNWGDVFRIEFTIEVKKIPESGWTNVFHLTADGNSGNIGDHIPALWIHNSGYFRICSTVSDHDECINHDFQLEKRHHMIIEQYIDGPEKHWYQITIDDYNVLYKENTQPRSFSIVKLFASDPWHNPFTADLGSICNVKIQQESELRARFIRSTKVSIFLLLITEPKKMNRIQLNLLVPYFFFYLELQTCRIALQQDKDILALFTSSSLKKRFILRIVKQHVNGW